MIQILVLIILIALNAFFASGQHGSSIIQIKGTEYIHMDSARTVF